MQEDQLRHRIDLVLAESQCRQPLADQLRADHVVVVERHLAARLEPASRRLADVVQQRGQPDDEVGLRRQPILQLDRLLEDGQAVLVDVLVPVVLVAFQPQRGQLGQHAVREPGPHQQIEADPRVLGTDQLDQLIPDPFRGDDRQAIGHRRHRGHDVRSRPKAQLRRKPRRPHHPQRVVAERDFRTRGRSQHSRRQVGQAAVRVHELLVRQGHRHGVHREVPPRQVTFHRVAEQHLRLATAVGVGVGSEGGDLDHPGATGILHLAADRPVLLADGPHRPGKAAQQCLDIIGPRGGGEVQIMPQPAQQRIPHAAAHQI